MKKYSGFTLIEMLIVMGIIIILMAAGIAGGRFAIQRANRIQKQNSVDNIEQALWGYYTDNRSFPRDSVGSNPAGVTPEDLLTNSDYLANYMDAGQFDGGIDGNFWYFVEIGRGQEFVVCGELHSDDEEAGIYCAGNGLDVLTAPVNFAGTTLPSDNIFRPDHPDNIYTDISNANGSFWNGETRSW